MACQFRNIPPKKLYLLSIEAHCAKGLISVGQTFMRGDNRAVYTRENKLRLTIAAAYIRREHPV